jgi:hypothetical protein
MRWLATNPEFEARYFRAREIAMEILADDLMTWSKQGLAADVDLLDIDGNPPTLSEITQAHRTRIAVKQWLMSKWAPKTWGGRTVERREPTAADRDALPTPQLARPPLPRLSPRPFTIPPIAEIAPITLAGLAMPRLPAEPSFDRDYGDDDEPETTITAPPPSRRQRRAMAAMARKHPPDLAQNSRAPP